MKALANRVAEIKIAPRQETHPYKHLMQRTTMKKGQGVRTGEGTKKTCGTVQNIISNSRQDLYGVEKMRKL
jgi:hypothetical protein